MGSIDVMATEYLADRERFVDAFNYCLYGGRRVVQPGSLSQLNVSGFVAKGRAGRRAPKSRRSRDLLKVWQAMEGGGIMYTILGLEEQSYVCREMPVRCMLYDAISYDGQVREIAKRNRENGASGTAEANFSNPMYTIIRLRRSWRAFFERRAPANLLGGAGAWPKEYLHGFVLSRIDLLLMKCGCFCSNTSR